MSKKILAAVVASVVAGQAAAITVVDDGTNKFTIGGHAGMRYTYDRDLSDNKTQAGGDASRINFQFESKLSEDVTAFARTEWGFDVTKIGNVDFNNRLGFVGVRSSDFGAISLGKQWSSYSQVGNWTDTFATADGAFGMYEDHEVLGTGRADDSIQYNLSAQGLNVSAQVQTGGSSALQMGDIQNRSRTRDIGYQIAASYDLPMGLSVGAAYNHVSFVEDVQAARAVVGAVKFEEGPIYAALTYGTYRNQASFVTGSDANGDTGYVAKNARNVELVGAYQLDENYSVQTGFMQLKDTDNSGNKVQNVPVELVYTTGPIQLSGTYTFEQSKRAGEKVKDKFVAQARYYF